MTSASHTPTSLATSKYAPATSRFAVQKEPLATTMSHALVTKEQLNSSHKVELTICENGGTQLALAQGEKLSGIITEYNTKFEKSLSASIGSLRALIESLRDTVKKTSGSDEKGIETINRLREELDRLFLLTTDMKQAVPKFIDQQKQNYVLYYQTALHSSIRQSYAEINMQKEKIDLQDSLILTQQKSFLQFQADTKVQLDQLAKFQERVSRLTLDRGLLKNELNKSKEDLEKMMASATDEKKTYEDLETHLKNLVATKKDLEVENQTLRNTLYESQLNALNAVKQSSEAKDRVAADTTALQERLQKETKLRQAAEALSVELKLQDGVNKAETTRLMNLNKMQLQKYNDQSNEFGMLTHNLSLTKKTIDGLKAQLEQANTEIAKLKTEQSTFLASKCLPEDTSKIIELQIDKKSLQSKLEKLQRENEELELENNELIAEKATCKNTQASKAIPDEGLSRIDELQATIDRLSTSNNDLEVKVQDVEAKKTKLDEDFVQWQALAKDATKRYKDQVAKTRETEKGAEDQRAKMDEKITQLEAQLRSSRNEENGANESSKHEAITYWKGRYESLLNKVSGITKETS